MALKCSLSVVTRPQNGKSPWDPHDLGMRFLTASGLRSWICTYSSSFNDKVFNWYPRYQFKAGLFLSHRSLRDAVSIIERDIIERSMGWSCRSFLIIVLSMVDW